MKKVKNKNYIRRNGASVGMKRVTNTAEKIHLIPLYTKYKKSL